MSLEPLLAWDTLGMRGTCSSGFTLKASGEASQILPDPLREDPRADHGAGRRI